MTATATPSPPRRSIWFVNPAFDFVFIVGTPFLVWPLVKGAESLWSAELLGQLILITATGHYMATFVRAYGDALLFRRFAVRFVAVPIVILVAFVGLMVQGLGGPLLLLVALWGLWHWLAQAFGFSRIYDAKVGSFRPATAWLDKALVVSWFLGAVVLLPNAAASFSTLFLNAGVELPGPGFFEGLRAGVTGLVAVVSLAYLANLVVALVRREPVSWVKQACHVTTIGFYWFAFGYAPNVFVGYVLYELFHDIQYFAITWLACRSRVQRDGVRTWMGWMFRPGLSRALLFLAIMLAFGAADMGQRMTLEEGHPLALGLVGVVLTAAVLHYYYDGFIWKVREDALRGDLGMSGGVSERNRAAVSHAAAWGVFAVPLVALSMGLPAEEDRDLLAEAKSIVGAAPDSYEAHSRLASLAAERGDVALARTHYAEAEALYDGQAQPQFNYGAVLDYFGEIDAAERRFRRALENPEQRVMGQSIHAQAWVALGVLQAQRGEDAAARESFDRGSELGPGAPAKRLVDLATAVTAHDPGHALRLLAAATRLFGGAGLHPLLQAASAGFVAGDLERAASSLENFAAQAPNLDVLTLLFHVREAQGQLESMRRHVEFLLANEEVRADPVVLARAEEMMRQIEAGAR